MKKMEKQKHDALEYYKRYLNGDYTKLIVELEHSDNLRELLILAKCYLFVDQLEAAHKLLLKIEQTSEEANLLIQLLAYLNHGQKVTHIKLAEVIRWIESPKPERDTQHNPWIFVLGAPVDQQGHPTLRLQRTLIKAKALWDALKLPIIVTGGAVKTPFIEAQVMKTWLQNHGITSPIITETQSRNTIQNFQNCSPLIKDHTIDHLHVVTSDFHVNRATCIAHQILPDLGFTFHKADNPKVNATNRTIIEHYATYRDVTRIIGLWR